MIPLHERVLAALAGVEEGQRPFVLAASKLVVGVSGGPDSLVLLHCLRHIGPPSQLIVAHLDHDLRSDSAADAEFVRQTAVAHLLPYHTRRVDVAALARQKGWSLEEAARHARYAFLAEVASQEGATAVAVGHNADDQAETILLHLLRGSGLAGLLGMQPISPLPGANHLWLIRPLLEVSRAEIEAYCQSHQLQPRRDASNQDTAFVRNRLRQELLPLLASYNPQIGRHLRQLGQTLSADYAWLQTLEQQVWSQAVVARGSGWVVLDREQWRALPLSQRRSLLRRAVAQVQPAQVAVGFVSLEQARQVAERGHVGQRALLPGGVALVVDYGRLQVTAVASPLIPPLPQLPNGQALTLPIPGRVALANGWQLKATVANSVDLAHITRQDDPWQAFIAPGPADYLTVRPRRLGERFQPLGLGGQSATLKKVMIDRKIPAALRAAWPLVATDNHLVWLVGHRLDERVRVTAAAGFVVRLHCWSE